MKKVGYKILLRILNSLVYTKRLVFLFFKKIEPAFIVVTKTYKKTIGFWIYKIIFYAKRRTTKFIAPWKQNFFEIFSKRTTLQVVFFSIAFFLMFPYTKLYTKGNNDTPGKNTVLYALVGPGDQNFYSDEQVDITSLTVLDIAPWKEGALSVNSGSSETIAPQEIAGLGAGGSALQKPTIISGAVIKQPSPLDILSNSTASRSTIIDYEVKPGDTIGRIAESFDISVETILWANDLTSRSYIRPGDSLNILPTTGVLHIVGRGDTVGKIATKYDADSEKIIKANRLQNDGSDIVIGEKLVIPDGRKQQIGIARTVAPTQALRKIAAPPASVSAPAGSGYIWPTSVRRVTQYYGWRHTGVDIAGPVGTPLYAVKSGRVVMSQCGWNGGYGCNVRIDHGGGIITLYGHASQLLVTAGENVSQGQVIALMGSTGNSTGPHIHFEVRVNGARQNPFSYVR